MTKTYKHKTLGWIAEEKRESYIIENGGKNQNKCGIIHPCSAHIPKELIEGSNDREEAVDKDWIDDVRFEVWKGFGDRKDRFREAIEKHAPKQVKFTKKEFIDFFMFYSLNETTLRTEIVFDFLRQHNLLVEEPQGEPCQHESDGGVYLTLRKEGEEVKPPKSKCKKCGVFYRN